MPTNEERRECAKKLREIELVKLPDASSELEEIHNAIGCWFGQDHFSQEFNDRLADLIEPEPERTCHFEPDVIEVLLDEDGNEILDADGNEIETGEPAEDCSAFECSECGYPMIFDPDIGWFDYWSPYKPHFKYCPNCGARVIQE